MDHSSFWRPVATIESLRKRAALLAVVRKFFADRGVLEIETPVLSHASVTDVHLRAFSSQFNYPGSNEHKTLYLQTSPEFAMKRLLCAGSGSIYQICKAFRNEESGRFHNPEFTLLEWYRVGYNHFQLIEEIDALLQVTLNSEPLDIITYQQAFIEFCQLDPLTCSISELQTRSSELGFANIAENEQDPDILLQLLCSEVVEKQIGQRRPVALVGFPASQAALAKIDDTDPRVSCRFEIYFKGIELANGYHELTEPEEQIQRFNQDNIQRKSLGLPCMTIDEYFVNALQHGMPECAGVALGFDRLCMLALGAEHINQITTFPIRNA